MTLLLRLRTPLGEGSEAPGAAAPDGDPTPIGGAETADRFCRTCIFFHETRDKFLPGEAADLIPPACYFRGRVMPTGWCGGTGYQEDIP